MEQPDYDYLIKIKLIGDSGVGKSCILLRYVDGTYSDKYSSTIGVDFKIRTLHVGSKLVKLQLWDTAGQERFRSIAGTFRNDQGIVLVYDITDAASFEHIQGWMDEVDRTASPQAVRLLLGNKADLGARRQVDYHVAKAFADARGMPFMETSAKERTNVDNAFETMVEEVLARVARHPTALDAGGPALHLNQPRPTSLLSRGCCRS